jgi:hypothetical protein
MQMDHGPNVFAGPGTATGGAAGGCFVDGFTV